MFVSGCDREPDVESMLSQNPGSPGLTILGLDGATWDIIEPMIERGELPGFKKLRENGSWGDLRTFTPTESISIWTTIATGVSPSRHGLQTFTRRIPGTDRFVPSPGTDRKLPALWNMVSEQGKRVVAVKWFGSWPAEQVNGAFLSARLEAEDAEPRTYPASLFEEIDPFRYKSIMNTFPQPPLPAKNPPPQVVTTTGVNGTEAPGNPPMLIGQSQVKATMFDDTSVWLAGYHVYQKFKPDLFMMYLKSTDRVQHFLWGAQSAGAGDPRAAAEAEAIYSWYRFYDTIILELLADPSRILLVLSDHGFQSLEETPDPFNLWDIDCDRILEFCGLLARKGSSTEWNRTRCYTYRNLPFDMAVEFRLNLKDREPEGIIDPIISDETTESVSKILRSITTPEGTALFSEVLENKDSSSIRCKISRAIDLESTVSFDGRSMPVRRMLFPKALPRGIHTDAPPGIIAVHGPGIRKNQHLSTASVYDITPTALMALGLPIARDFDGNPLTELFEPDWLQNHPIRSIDSYGNRTVSENLITTQGDSRMLDELRALGYIQ